MIDSVKDKIGVLLVPSKFLDYSYDDFLQSVQPALDKPLLAWVTCHDPRFHGGFNIDYREVGIASRQFGLLAFPGDIPPQFFRNSDLEYPVKIAGCILTVNSQTIAEQIEWSNQSADFDFNETMKHPHWGGAAWIVHQHWPYIVAVEQLAASRLSYDMLRLHCNIGAEIPSVLCAGQFEMADIQLALSKLVERINLNQANSSHD